MTHIFTKHKYSPFKEYFIKKQPWKIVENIANNDMIEQNIEINKIDY